MAIKASAGEQERMMALSGSPAYYESDYLDMERGPGGPIGSFTQVILWIIVGFVTVALVIPVLLVGAAWAIWHFRPAGWRP